MELGNAGLLPIIQLLNAFGPALLVLLALSHDGGTQPRAKIVGKFVKLGVAVNLNSLLGGIANHVAVVAPGEMVLQLDFCGFVEDAV
jgi:hypothetical protein